MTPLLEYTLKVSVIVLAGLTVSALLRRQSAAGRHWVLSMALISGLALPLIGRALPEWSAWSIFESTPMASRPLVPLPRPAHLSGDGVTVPIERAAEPRHTPAPLTSVTVARVVPFAWAAGTVPESLRARGRPRAAHVAVVARASGH